MKGGVDNGIDDGIDNGIDNRQVIWVSEGVKELTRFLFVFEG